MYHIICIMYNGYAVSLKTLSVHLRLYATCKKLYGKIYSPKQCS